MNNKSAFKVETPNGWLRENAVLISAENIGNQYFYKEVWYLTANQANYFQKLMQSRDIQSCTVGQCVKAGTNKQPVYTTYFTTLEGLIVIGSEELPTKSVVKVSGLNILCMEVSREQWFPSTSKYARQIAGITTDHLIQKELDRIQRDKEEKERFERIAQQVKETRARLLSIVPKTPEYEQLIKDAFNSDHHYSYIEDRDQYRSAVKLRDEIIARFEPFGLNGKDLMKEIDNAHYG